MSLRAGLYGHRLLWVVAWVLTVTLAGVTGVVQAQRSAEASLEVDVTSPAVWWHGSGSPFDPSTLEIQAFDLESVYVTSATFTVGSTTSYGIEVEVRPTSPTWNRVLMEQQNAAVRGPNNADDGFDIAVYNGDASEQDSFILPADNWSPFMTAKNDHWSTNGHGAHNRPRNTAYGASDPIKPLRDHHVVIVLVMREQDRDRKSVV